MSESVECAREGGREGGGRRRGKERACLHKAEHLASMSNDSHARLGSFGVVLWELSTGMQPDGRFLRPISAGEDCPEEVAALMLRCLKEDPNERPSAVDIVHALQQ